MKFFQSIIFSFLLLCLHYATNAQTPMFQRTWGGNGNDYGFAVLLPDTGYAILGSMDWTNLNASHATLIRTDKYGDTLWTRNFYYTNTPVNANSISLTHDNCLLVAIDSSYYGRTYKINLAGNILWIKDMIGPFEPFVKTYDGGYITSGGNSIAKFDSLLNTQFVMYYGPSLDHGGFRSRAIQATDSGFVMVGTTRMLASGGPSDRDIYVVKTDKNGNLQWDKSFGHASGIDIASDIIQTPDGGYLVCGYTDGLGAGMIDILLIKLDQNSNTQWIKTYGGTSSDLGIFIRKTIGSTDYYIVAQSPGMENNIYNGSKTILIKIDMNGNYLFGKIFRDPNFSNIAEIANNSCFATPDGGIMICGTKDVQTSLRDAWVIKTDQQCNSGCNEINVVPTIFSHTLVSNSSGLQLSNPFQTGQGRQHQISYAPPQEIIICTNHIITGTNETENNYSSTILMYPNPSNGVFTIDAQNLKTIAVYDVLGKQILMQQPSSQKTIIDLTPQPNGIYFVQCVLAEGEVFNQKIIKQ